jgi:hypothetical protein
MAIASEWTGAFESVYKFAVIKCMLDASPSTLANNVRIPCASLTGSE